MKSVYDIVAEVIHTAAVCVEDHRHGVPCWRLALVNAFAQERHEYETLRGEIEKVLDTSADDICWLDVYRDLATTIGRKFDPKLLPRAVFERNCARYAAAMYEGKPYERDEVSEQNVRLQARVAELEAALKPFADLARGEGNTAFVRNNTAWDWYQAAVRVMPDPDWPRSKAT